MYVFMYIMLTCVLLKITVCLYLATTATTKNCLTCGEILIETTFVHERKFSLLAFEFQFQIHAERMRKSHQSIARKKFDVERWPFLEKFYFWGD